MINEWFWRRTINMAEFDDLEFDRARIDTEKRMRDNYKKYMLSLSNEERQERMFLCEQDFEKDFLKDIGKLRF